VTERLWLAIGADYEREARAVLAQVATHDVALVTLPSDADPRAVGWRQVEEALGAAGHRPSEEVHILDGRALLASGPPPAGLRSVIHATPTCCALLVSHSFVEHCAAEGKSVVSPGRLMRWRKTRDEGERRIETAPDFIAESAKQLVLLDSGVTPGVLEAMAALGQAVDRPCAIVPVGLDFFTLVLGEIIAAWRLAKARRDSMAEVSRANREAADLFMVMDLIGELVGVVSRDEVVAKVLDLFVMLFAPRVVAFAPVPSNSAAIVFRPAMARDVGVDDLQAFLAADAESASTTSGQGFMVRVSHRATLLGAVLTDGIRFPEFVIHYRGLASIIARVCGLSLANAESYEALGQANTELREALERIKTLRGLLPICMHCKKIRDDSGYWQKLEEYLGEHSEAEFSHGICPSCFERNYPDTPPGARKASR